MSILLVAGIEGARNCADAIAKHLGREVLVAEGRRAALAILRQPEFAALVVDETIAECDPIGADTSGSGPGWPSRCRSTSRSLAQRGWSAISVRPCAEVSASRRWRDRRPLPPSSQS